MQIADYSRIVSDNNTSKFLRINKYLACCGICSRRAADEHILHGEVMINGKPAKPGDRVHPQNDRVLFRGRPVKYISPNFEYWAAYKPVGYISTVSDELNRRKVTELVKSTARLYPVGRLDEDSEGLIVLTNDGDLTKVLTHPSHEHEKFYTVFAKQTKNNSLEWLKSRLLQGIEIEGKNMRASKVSKIIKLPNSGLIQIELSLVTGYNRQIRRMCDKIGLQVERLIRTGIADLKLSQLRLRPGESKSISRSDILISNR